MNSKFQELLYEYLQMECSDYEIFYTWEWNNDLEQCEVNILSNGSNEIQTTVNFRQNDKGNLEIETGEDVWKETFWFDTSVKYFWIKVAPAIFPNN
jgi:hypothetical protein